MNLYNAFSIDIFKCASLPITYFFPGCLGVRAPSDNSLLPDTEYLVKKLEGYGIFEGKTDEIRDIIKIGTHCVRVALLVVQVKSQKRK